MEDKHVQHKTTNHKSQSSSMQSQSILSRPKPQAQLLLELTAISGEYPADNIPRLIPSASYAKKVVTVLTGDKLIKLVNKGGIKGYRLDVRGKKKLLAENRARFDPYLDGAMDTNKLRSDQPRRLRLHSAAEVYTMMLGAGVQIFKDTKPIIYRLDTSANPSQSALSQMNNEIAITIPCFYSSREQKGEDDKAIRASRAVGTLLTPTHVYAIYNTGSAESRWHDSVELRYRAEVQSYICRNLLRGQYKGAEVSGILIGEGLEILMKYLVADAKTSAAHKFATNTYHPFYFITNDDYGKEQLKLLCDYKGMIALKNLMSQRLYPPDPKAAIDHDAITEDGNPVLFCCLMNIPRLVKFKTGLQLHEKVGKVVAFDFQKEVLKQYLGETVEHTTFSLEKVMQMIYPS